MTENIISLQEYRPHLSGTARCLFCRHEWVAIADVGNHHGYECPACGLYRGAMLGLMHPRKSVFICNCGCDIFIICGDEGVMCVNCGTVARGYDD